MDDLGVGLVGHSGPKRVISNTLAAGKLGHASLLVGPSGVGRKLFARGIGKYLLCHRNQESGGIRGCGVCRSCELFEAGTHPDFREFSKPEEDQEFKMALMEDVIQWFALMPSMGFRKITIIEDIDFLNEESANSFLKAAEEPPPGMWLAMLSENPERLPQTIRSRCQPILFSRLSEADTLQVLQQKSGMEQGKAVELARLSEGVPGRAIDLADPDLWKLWASLSSQLIPGRFNSCTWADELKSWVDSMGSTGALQRPALRKVLYLFACLASDLLRLNQGMVGAQAPIGGGVVLAGLAARFGEVQIRKWYELTVQADIRTMRKAQVGLVIEAYADDVAQLLSAT